MKPYFKILFALSFSLSLSCNSSMETGPEPFLEVNDDFVQLPLGFEITEANLLESFPSIFTVTNKAVQNRHDSSVTDTLKTFESKDKDYFLIYKTQDKELVKEAKIRSATVILKDNIRVGMSKSEFAKKLNVETWPQIMIFCDTEQTTNWTFYFSNSELDSIWHQNYVD